MGFGLRMTRQVLTVLKNKVCHKLHVFKKKIFTVLLTEQNN